MRAEGERGSVRRRQTRRQTRRRQMRRPGAKGRALRQKFQSDREFTKGGLVKGGLAIYAFPLRNCNALASV